MILADNRDERKICFSLVTLRLDMKHVTNIPITHRAFVKRIYCITQVSMRIYTSVNKNFSFHIVLLKQYCIHRDWNSQLETKGTTKNFY